MVRINYIIASWDGPRISKIKDQTSYLNVLSNHIQHLNMIDNSITEVTIMKPNSPYNNIYYDFDSNNLNINIVECENEFQSYGQWFKGVLLNLNKFDYFIFIEDDYIPNIDNFDIKLIDIYEEGTYLCGLLSDKMKNNKHINHCAISNGIISNETIKNIISTVDFKEWFNNPKSGENFNNTNYQIVFSKYFSDNGITLKDYTNDYGVDFHYMGKIIDYSKNETLTKILTPIQTLF